LFVVKTEVKKRAKPHKYHRSKVYRYYGFQYGRHLTLAGAAVSGRVFLGSGISPKYGAGFGKTKDILTGFRI